MDPIRVLVVDDYEPFRRLIRSTLEDPSFRIIGEASDGLEAVQKATLGLPDLILLDIGLPKLNGLKAAEQIRQVVPQTRILFLSQEPSIDVVQYALSLGALGYLHKTRTHRELLPAIESVLAGKQFVSTGLERDRFTESPNSDCHEVEFYSDEATFLSGVGSFAAAALNAGEPVIVMATTSHRQGLIQGLRNDGVDIDDAVQQARYISLDATELLSRIMVGGSPDVSRFFDGLSGLIKSASAAAKKRNPRISICGECVGILCVDGNTNAAIQLEKIGNELIKTHNIEILCCYPLTAVQGDGTKHAFASVCREHSAVRIR
jgi:DNA-binding NarL/FixJ family response regulator